MRNKQMPQKVKDKISKTMLAKHITRSDDTRAKISASMKQQWQNATNNKEVTIDDLVL